MLILLITGYMLLLDVILRVSCRHYFISLHTPLTPSCRVGNIRLIAAAIDDIADADAIIFHATPFTPLLMPAAYAFAFVIDIFCLLPLPLTLMLAAPLVSFSFRHKENMSCYLMLL